MGGLGFITDATTGMPTPNSMYNVSTVSINESFSPLLGIDVTLNNNLTVKAEYRKTRVLSLSMTSVQVNESSSNDWVIGAGYTINNFNLFGGGGSNKHRKQQLVAEPHTFVERREQRPEAASRPESAQAGVDKPRHSHDDFVG